MQATNSGQGKIYHLATSWYALVSGDISFANNLILLARKELAADPSLYNSTLSLKSYLETLYQKCRDEAIEQQVLKPDLLTIPLFAARPSTLLPLDKTHYDSLLAAIRAYKAQTDILICGFDGTGRPHILCLDDPGVCTSYDSLGYHAVGIGTEAALVRLAGMDTDRKDPLAKSIYGVFDAKVNTEIYQGISYKWDGEVLCKGNMKSRKIPRQLIDTLDRVYRAFPRSPFDESFKEPKGWWRRLDAFSRKIMPGTITPRVHHVRRIKR